MCFKFRYSYNIELWFVQRPKRNKNITFGADADIYMAKESYEIMIACYVNQRDRRCII